MGKIKDLTGKRFGRLTIIKKVGIKKNRVIWLCECDCGNTVKVTSNCLTSGGTRSCGCIHKEQLKKRNSTHGLSNHPLYKRWKAIKVRCYNKKYKYYKNYGGRNINMCDEWKNNFISFYNWCINNGYSEELTIDRIDNNGNYEPSNCRWVTYAEQMRNYRKNHYITFHGETLCLKDMAEKYNIKPKALSYRLENGWSVEKALTTPLKK